MKIYLVSFLLHYSYVREISAESAVERYGANAREWLTGSEELYVADDPYYFVDHHELKPLVEATVSDLKDRYEISLDMISDKTPNNGVINREVIG